MPVNQKSDNTFDATRFNRPEQLHGMHVYIDGISFQTVDTLPNCMLWFGRMLERVELTPGTLIEITSLRPLGI